MGIDKIEGIGNNTFSSGDWAVENEIVEIGAEQRKVTLSGVGLERSLDCGGNNFLLIDNKSDRAGAAEDSNTDQQAVFRCPCGSSSACTEPYSQTN